MRGSEPDIGATTSARAAVDRAAVDRAAVDRARAHSRTHAGAVARARPAARPPGAGDVPRSPGLSGFALRLLLGCGRVRAVCGERHCR